MDVPDLPIVPEEDTSLPAGTRLGKYQIVRLLGAGGMGAVYEAVHTDIGKRVAVKTLAPALAATSAARQRFLREAQLTSRLRHPHIVDVTDMGTEGRVAYLVMELLAGEDLSHRLERTGPMAPRVLIDLMLPVCAALIEAHAAGIVHRDLKPHNIFLAKGHHGVEPKVLDFGISKSSDTDVSGLTTTGSLIGTPHYLAPEQIKDARSASAASDQYSIGVIFYKCLTGRNPFEGDSVFAVLQAIVSEKVAPLGAWRSDLPAGLDRVVARAMSPLPRERFASVRDLGLALLPYASDKARVIWKETFAAGRPIPVVPARAPEASRDSHTMPMPTPEWPVRFASAIPTMKAERLRRGARPSAGSSSASLDLEALVTPRRGRIVAGVLLVAALAVGGDVLYAHRGRTPEAPDATGPATAVSPSETEAEAKRREAQAAEAKAAKERAAAEKAAEERAAQARAAAAAEAARRAAEATAADREAAEAAAADARRRAAQPKRHGVSRPRPEEQPPTAPPPPRRPTDWSPNGAPVID